MEDGGRERKQGSGQKGNPKISKSSCRPVTVGWSQGFHGNGELLVIYPVWEPEKNRFCLRA
jgi:hypothetical protein